MAPGSYCGESGSVMVSTGDIDNGRVAHRVPPRQPAETTPERLSAILRFALGQSFFEAGFLDGDLRAFLDILVDPRRRIRLLQRFLGHVAQTPVGGIGHGRA